MRPTVLFIAGAGRSGSTLLDLLLGSTAGCVSTGELSLLGDAWHVETHHCSCGELIADCAFWQRVLTGMVPADASAAERAIGGQSAVLATLQREALRVRHTPRLLWNTSRRRRPDAVHSGWEAVELLYRRIAAESGARVIVESSKSPAACLLLSLLQEVDARVVHLVRDPRAVAWSWMRGPRTERAASGLPRRGPVPSMFEWLSVNLMLERVRRRFPAERWLRVRYEDLVAEPSGTLGAIARFAGMPTVPAVSDGAVEVGETHLVAGNPVRLDGSLLRLNPDDEWRHRLPPAWRSYVAAVTTPLRRRYGY